MSDYWGVSLDEEMKEMEMKAIQDERDERDQRLASMQAIVPRVAIRVELDEEEEFSC